MEEKVEKEITLEGEEGPSETPPPRPVPEWAAWYVVHCYSGYENKVKKSLENRISSSGFQDRIFAVVVPSEQEVEMREGKKRTVERRIFPGYILVQMLLDDDTWSLVRNTPGVTGFVGAGTRPNPLRQEEVDKILQRMESPELHVRVSFRRGETVRITAGPFTDFMGTVEEISPEKGKVKVLVSFFGRETPVELDLLEVEKG